MCLALFLTLCIGVAQSTFTDFQLVGKRSFDKPAFMNFIRQGENDNAVDLSVTQFGYTFDGQVSLVRNISSAFDNNSTVSLDSMNVDVVGENFIWPNDARELADGVLCESKQQLLCGSTSTCRVIAVPDGFLPPGKQTGSIYLQGIAEPGQDSLPPIKIAEEETFWYYHRAEWVDMDNDGLMDILAARAYTNNVGMSKGQLVWLKQPSNSDDFQKPWPLSVLTEGPDVIILADQSVDGCTLPCSL